MLICIVSYPRSGQVWLTRTLAHAIGCPVYTYLPQDSGRDIAFEGRDRRSPHRVTRAHWLNTDDGSEYWPKPDKIIHLVRDPRDLAVSIKHFMEFRDFDESTAYLLRSSWSDFVDTYSKLSNIELRYADLVEDTAYWLERIITSCGLTPDAELIDSAVEENRFDVRRSAFQISSAAVPVGVLDQLRHMRKGVPRQWSGELTAAQVSRIEAAFGPQMQRYGYVLTTESDAATYRFQHLHADTTGSHLEATDPPR